MTKRTSVSTTLSSCWLGPKVLFKCILILGFVSFLLSCSFSKEKRMEGLITKGNAYFSKNKYQEALRSWKKALSLQPNHPEIFRKIAKTYLLMAENEKAAETFHKLILSDPRAWDAWLELGKLKLADLDFASAEVCWNHIRRKENDPRTHIFHGDLLVTKNQIEDAELAYKMALTFNPNDPIATIKLASCYHAQGKKNLALQIVRRVEPFAKNSLEALIQMSNFSKLAGDLGKAEGYLKKAIKVNPHDLGLKQILAEFYFDSEAYLKALKTVDQMVIQAPSNIFLKKFRIEIFFSLNELEMANAAIDELSELIQEDLEFQLLKGKYYLFKREFTNALSQFTLVVEKEPNLPLAHYLLSLAYLCGGQISLAQGGLTQALILDPKFTDAELILANLYYKREEFDLSLEHAQRISEREPENYRAHLIIGHSLLALGKHKDAIAQFELANQINPSSPSPQYYSALALMEANNEKEAMKSYVNLLKDHPDIINATQDYVMLLVKTGQASIAKNYLKSQTFKDQKNEYLFHLLGEVNLALDEIEEAKANFKNAILIAPKLVSSYMRLSNIYLAEKDWEKLRNLLETCVERFPSYPDVYVKLGNLYLKLDQHDQAESILLKGLSQNPDSPQIANNLAWYYIEYKMDLDKAFSYSQNAYQNLPNNPAVADTLGWIYYKKKLLNQSVWLLEEALLQAPDNAMINYHLGVVHLEQGNSAKSKEMLNQALELNLEDPYKNTANQLLQKL